MKDLSLEELTELRDSHQRIDSSCGNTCCAYCRVCGDLKGHYYCSVLAVIFEHQRMVRDLEVEKKKILNIKWLIDASPRELKDSWLDETQRRDTLIMDLIGKSTQDGVMPQREDFNHLRK